MCRVEPHQHGRLVAPWADPLLLAGALAIVVAWTTRNVLLTILAGMAALVALQLVLV